MISRSINKVREVFSMENMDELTNKIEEAMQQMEKRVEEIEKRLEGKIEEIVVKRGGPLTDVGDVVTRELDITDFANVEVSHAFRVEITRSDTYSVAITANEKLFDYIDAVKSGDTLKIGMKPHLSIRGSITLEAKIAMPVLKKLRLSGASKGTAKGFSSQEDFDLHLSGASTLDIDIEAGKTKLETTGASKLNGEMKLDDADIALSGASRAELKGSANNVNLNASGASRLDLADFPLNDAEVYLSGASRATVNAKGNLDINLSGASRLEYAGNPTIRDIKVSGASKIKKK